VSKWDDIRADLEIELKAQQEVGDDYSEQNEERAQHHWGRAAACRDILGWMAEYDLDESMSDAE
jgi:hypothetical protein